MGMKILEAASGAYGKTAEGFESATEQISYALKNLSSVSEYDEQLADFESQLSEIDNLLNDFNRELASYLADTTFDEQTFTEVENRLNVINHLKNKIWKYDRRNINCLQRKKSALRKVS